MIPDLTASTPVAPTGENGARGHGGRSPRAGGRGWRTGHHETPALQGRGDVRDYLTYGPIPRPQGPRNARDPTARPEHGWRPEWVAVSVA